MKNEEIFFGPEEWKFDKDLQIEFVKKIKGYFEVEDFQSISALLNLPKDFLDIISSSISGKSLKKKDEFTGLVWEFREHGFEICFYYKGYCGRPPDNIWFPNASEYFECFSPIRILNYDYDKSRSEWIMNEDYGYLNEKRYYPNGVLSWEQLGRDGYIIKHYYPNGELMISESDDDDDDKHGCSFYSFSGRKLSTEEWVELTYPNTLRLGEQAQWELRENVKAYEKSRGITETIIPPNRR